MLPHDLPVDSGHAVEVVATRPAHPGRAASTGTCCAARINAIPLRESASSAASPARRPATTVARRGGALTPAPYRAREASGRRRRCTAQTWYARAARSSRRRGLGGMRRLDVGEIVAHHERRVRATSSERALPPSALGLPPNPRIRHRDRVDPAEHAVAVQDPRAPHWYRRVVGHATRWRAQLVEGARCASGSTITSASAWCARASAAPPSRQASASQPTRASARRKRSRDGSSTCSRRRRWFISSLTPASACQNASLLTPGA